MLNNDIDNIKLQQQHRIVDSGSFPKVILLDTCSYCNLRCCMCFHHQMKRKKGVMSWELFTKIIDEVASEDRCVRIWMVFFGEPFVIRKRKPSIFDMIAYAKRKDLRDIVLNTNGNLMEDEDSLKLIELELDAVYVGIDAFTENTYRKIRVGGQYEKVKNNVLSLLRLKKELKVTKPEVFVQFVEMDQNRHEKDDYAAFWNQAGAIVKIRPKISWAGNIKADNLRLDNDDRWPCHWAMQTMSITDTGDVVTCAVDLDARFVAGNVSRQTLKEVWNGRLAELRKMHTQKRWDDLPEICRECRDWQGARSEYVKNVL